MLRTLLLFAYSASCAIAAQPPGFRKSAHFDEGIREEWIAPGVRAIVNVPANFDPKKPTRLILFATPNGNTIEQTLGCAAVPGRDFRFDIQHVAAQTRKYREVNTKENVVLACVESEVLAWPAWKKARPDGPKLIRGVVETLKKWLPAGELRITLACHSGGGSFLFGYIDGGDTIPDEIDRIIFLDANYSYTDADKHGEKLLTWMKADSNHRLIVIAYDDRKIEIDGKPIIGPTGGTFRATERMTAFFTQHLKFEEAKRGDITTRTSPGLQLAFVVHANPQNKILHTALVGEMNGLLHGLTIEDPMPAWGTFGGPRAYSKMVQPAPAIPPRPKDAEAGSKFAERVAKMTREQREEAIAGEILKGNIPDFLRKFVTLEVAKDMHKATFEVMPDYLAVGSDDDFVRVPMNTATAARIAEAFGCSLPTRKMVDDIHKAAKGKYEPKLMTKDRDSWATMLEHHGIIESQRKGQPLGDLVSGIKKDVVITNRLEEKPNRVAIYGWHKLDGSPIQPLNVSHVDWYVDYSHGVRLVKREVKIDGKLRDLRPALYSKDTHELFSDEGPIRRPSY